MGPGLQTRLYGIQFLSSFLSVTAPSPLGVPFLAFWLEIWGFGLQGFTPPMPGLRPGWNGEKNKREISPRKFLDSHSTEKDFSSLGLLGACPAAGTAATPNFETGACLGVGLGEGFFFFKPWHFFYSVPKGPLSLACHHHSESFFWSFFCSHLLCSSGVWASRV